VSEGRVRYDADTVNKFAEDFIEKPYRWSSVVRFSTNFLVVFERTCFFPPLMNPFLHCVIISNEKGKEKETMLWQ
jgi:hypothetical protein